MTDFTRDRFLDGRVVLMQPARSFRSGLDAVVMAASIPVARGARVLELGCGAGVASLCLAARVKACSITGIDLQSVLVALANENARMNGFESRVEFVEADALSLPRSLRREFDHVFCNPPFHRASGARSPDRGRAVAVSDEGRLREWVRSGLKRVRAQGTFTTIVRADRLGDVFESLPAAGVSVFPLWPHAGEPAKRVVVQVRKGSAKPLALLPGLILHEKDGRHTLAAEAVLRDAASLALGSRPL